MTIVRATFWTSLASTADYRVMRNVMSVPILRKYRGLTPAQMGAR
jgi:hypothetical protein